MHPVVGSIFSTFEFLEHSGILQKKIVQDACEVPLTFRGHLLEAAFSATARFPSECLGNKACKRDGTRGGLLLKGCAKHSQRNFVWVGVGGHLHSDRVREVPAWNEGLK